jgi:signal transduction histidine kinase/DNA-binding response OmpR family regulator
VGSRFKVAVYGASPELQERISAELDAPLFEAPATFEGVYILAGNWQDEQDNLPNSRGARVALVADQQSEDLTVALASGSLHGLADEDFAAGSLQTACQRAWNHYSLKRGLVARSTGYIDAIDVLSRLGVELAAYASRSEILKAASRTASELCDADTCGIVLVDQQHPPMLHLHCNRSCSEARLRTLKSECVSSYMRTTGRGLNEDKLRPQHSGLEPTSDEQEGVETKTLEVPLEVGGVAMGMLLVSFGSRVSWPEGTKNILELAASRITEALRRLGTRRVEERRRLGLMVESMADGLIMTELERDEVLINPAARRLLKIDAGTRVTQVYLKERLGFYPFDLVAANPDSSELLREELSIGDKMLHSMVSPVRERSGALIGVVVVLRDFTEAHSLAHRQHEFVAIVSHELRSPLTSISGALEIALSEYAGRLNDKQRQYLTLARESCTALNHIVDDLLDVARAENGGMTIHIGPVDLNRLTEQALEQYRAAALAKQIDLVFTPSEGELRLAGDPERLTQVLNNLLSNALKFTPIKGCIEVEVFGPPVSSSHVGVSVSNNGDVIAEEARERIFEKFEQIKGSSTRRVGGTGLGLAISRSIIEAHGGRIWVESSDKGAKFVLTLPATPTEAEGQELKKTEFDSTLTGAPLSGTNVLLVDGDIHSSYILKGILMSAGHEVSVASDADTALLEARKRLPPLIIVHASDELGDARSLIEILRHDSETRKSAVMALAHHPDSFRSESISVLAFPVDPELFQRECARLIQEAGSAQGGRVLVVEDDPAIRTICTTVLRAAGMTVREAANGLACLTEAKRFQPDLFLLDIMMPDLDGFQTAEHLKADPATSLTPIIFLSARGETSDKVEAFRLGAEDYIVKPFVAAELVARVRKALERSDRELGASPTTQLPGGGAIQAEMELRLSDESAAFCYLDLDNLKAYNDYYSYAKADSIRLRLHHHRCPCRLHLYSPL